MDECDACRHIRALHVSATGPCRLNGCRCTRYEQGPILEPGPEDELVAVPDGRSIVPASLVSALIGFLLGLAAGSIR